MPESTTSDSLWSTVAGVAERTPDTEAILSPGRQPLRFRDLRDRLRMIRDDLARLGIGREDRVAMVLRRGPETAVCAVGLMSCATCIPLNPDFSEAELANYFTQLRPAAIIVPEGHGTAARSAASALGIRIVELVARMSDPAGTFSLISHDARGTSQRVASWNNADDTALVLFTSGSTAEPKAVPLRVRHLVAYARLAGEHYELGPHDRCLHVMPMFHGHGLKSTLLVPLLNGSGVIASPEFNVPTFFQHLAATAPTWYSAAPSMHQAILARVDEFREGVRHAKLRFIRSGSGRLDPKVMAGLEKAFGVPMLECYSMSETGGLAANRLPPAVRKPGCVGPRVGSEIAIMGEDGHLLGPNRQGEIVARGPCVFDGYLDNPEATRAAFHDGWFRTGDLGQFDDDGHLRLAGRIKDVINRGGEKIGTTEVETALLQHPEVMEVCVFGMPHPTLGEDVAAAVVTRRSLGQQEVQTFARGLLTGIKVPRRVFFLPSLPKNVSNKIRRAETAALCLALLERSKPEAESASTTWSRLEREIAAEWKRVLGIDEVGLDDDFFLLGGNSLHASELFARFHQNYRIALNLGQLFEEASTVAGMARLIERARNERSSEPKETSGMVTMKGTGARPPLFVVPGRTGNPVGFIHLARLLDPRQPVIGIEARGMDGIESPLARMADIAADNVARIRKMQPRGPYFLAGQCFGGQVAYEMARQLEAAGERVGLLIMMNAPSPFVDRTGRRRGVRVKGRRTSRSLSKYVYGRIRRHLTSLVQLRGQERRAFVREKIRAVQAIIGTGDLFRGDRRQFARRAVYEANRKAGRNYVPGPFGGATVLYLTRDRAFTDGRDHRLDWLKLLPQIENPIYVSGRHLGDMQSPPHVYELVGLVNEQLEIAHATEERCAGQDTRSSVAATTRRKVSGETPDHILRIRWDLPFTRPSWHTDRGKNFQEYRWSLFTRFTLPSLQRQSVPWRVWLWADRELAHLHAQLPLDDPRVRFVYDLDQEARLVADTEPDRTFVIGSLDSDDMLAPDTLEVLGRTSPVDSGRPLLQLFSGCAYDAHRNLLLPWRHPSPAFVFRPVMSADLAAGMPSLGGKHSRVHQESRHLTSPVPYFCVVLHGNNLDNSPEREYAKGKMPLRLERACRSRFGLPQRTGVVERVFGGWTRREGDHKTSS